MIPLRKYFPRPPPRKKAPLPYSNITRAPLLQVAHPTPMEAAQVAQINSIYKEKCMLL